MNFARKVTLISTAVFVSAALGGTAYIYQIVSPSNADHALASLVSGDHVALSVNLNLRPFRLFGMAPSSIRQSFESINEYEKYVFKSAGLPGHQGAVFAKTFSSVLYGLSLTEGKASTLRAYAPYGSVDEALLFLESHKLIEKTQEGLYVFINSSNCEKSEPQKLIRGDRSFAFASPSLAEQVTKALSGPVSSTKGAFDVVSVKANFSSVTKAIDDPMILMAIQSTDALKWARNVSANLRLKPVSDLTLDLVVDSERPDELNKAWSEMLTSSEDRRAEIERYVTVTSESNRLVAKVDLNEIKKLTDIFMTRAGQTAESIAKIKDKILEDTTHFYKYDSTTQSAALTKDQVKVAISSLSRPEHSDSDLVKLQVSAKLPGHWAPLLAREDFIQVNVKSPVKGHPHCGPLAEANQSVDETEDARLSSDEKTFSVNKSLEFALEGGVDSQKLTAIEGSLTLNIPSKFKTMKVAFAPPYSRIVLPFSRGSIAIRSEAWHRDELLIKFEGQAEHPALLRVRALNAEGKYLEVEEHRGNAGQMTLPFFGKLNLKNESVVVSGKPTELEVAIAEATTPEVIPFKVTMPFPESKADHDVKESSNDKQAGLLTAETFEAEYLSETYIAQAKKWFADFSTSKHEDVLTNRMNVASPIGLFLNSYENFFKGKLRLVMDENLKAVLEGSGTDIKLEIEALEFADGTKLTPADMELKEDSNSEERYVWGDFFGKKMEWQTDIGINQNSTGSYNNLRSVSFDRYIPRKKEDVPVTRLKGRISLSIPSGYTQSAIAPLNLRDSLEINKSRYRLSLVSKKAVTLISEGAHLAGIGARFFDANGNVVPTALSRVQEFDDKTAWLNFETSESVRKWQLTLAVGPEKSFTFPFEFLDSGYVRKPASQSSTGKKKGATRRKR